MSQTHSKSNLHHIYSTLLIVRREKSCLKIVDLTLSKELGLALVILSYAHFANLLLFAKHSA